MTSVLPNFSNLNIKLFSADLEHILSNHLNRIEQILAKEKPFTWDNLILPLDEMEDELERFWSPLSHLHAVVNSPELRQCYQACLPKLSAYSTAIGQNQALYDAIHSISKQELNPTQCKIIEDALRDFKLSGVALAPQEKQRFEAISAQLSQLSNQFENNVLDAVNAYELHIEDGTRLRGLPEHTLDNARQLAEKKQLSGWIFNLESPSFLAIVTYADDRALRETIYQAYVTRASDQGPTAGRFDNSTIMNDTLALRHEMANLLGFDHYASLSLATKMAESCQHVIQFLQDLTQRAHHQAEEEFKQLQDYAKKTHQVERLEPWDIAYYSEKKKQDYFSISEEALRPYFPLNQVLQGLFIIVQKLYGMRFEEIRNVDIWHPDVTCYQIIDDQNQIRGYIYLDLFARPHKRGGAWMDSLQTRYKRADGSIQLPIATLTCNFAKPAAHKPPTLSHDEVNTLFHEFGHCLQHVLTQVDYFSASGIQGVEWDAVELPSQFFENWCWDKEALQLLTQHVDTGAHLPDEMFDKILAAKNFQSAMAMLRQLEFSLFDFLIHQNYTESNPQFISNTLATVRQSTSVIPVVSYNRFQHSFTHIFSGGYAAGYYSYKWAEVLSSDAFSRFEEEGIFSAKAGRDFLHFILESGSSRKAMDSYVAFRGRVPTIDALLNHNGIYE